MTVQDFMTQGVATVRPQDSLHAAAGAMWQHDCGVLPVVDENDRVIAMLTDRDVCMAAFHEGKPLTAISVGSAMSKGVFSCHPTDAVSAAEAKMREHQVRRLPVVGNGGRLVGILSLNDVALEADPKRTSSRPDVTAEEVSATLAAICKHRMATPAAFIRPMRSS